MTYNDFINFGLLVSFFTASVVAGYGLGTQTNMELWYKLQLYKLRNLRQQDTIVDLQNKLSRKPKK